MLPFEDREDFQFQLPRQPNLAERWLRRIFVEDWDLKLMALAITLVLWFAVAGQKKPMTKRIAGVQLSFVHPDELEISNDPPAHVDVTLTGSSDKLAQINAADLGATVLVGDHAAGERVVRLSPARVSLDLPEGVQVEGFYPAMVSVRLEPKVERPVDVQVKFEGKVPEGYEVSSSANPAQVKVSGPASHVNNLEKAPTESISLDGRKGSFDLADVAINISDPKINVLDTVVKVHVEIGERIAEKSFNDVPVRSVSGAEVRPRIASVTLVGPASAFAQLHPEDIRVVVDTSAGRDSGPPLELPPSLQDKIKLRAIKPSSFTAQR